MECAAALSMATLAFFGTIQLAIHSGPPRPDEQINYPDWGPPEINEQEDS